MRTLSSGLLAMLGRRSQTRCAMLRLDLADGTAIGLTDHDQVIAGFDLGDGAIDYRPRPGIKLSDLVLVCGTDADNCEVRGPILPAGPFARAALLGGRFNRARARLFQVNWQAPADGAIALLGGNVGEARVEGGEWVFELRSDKDRLNQRVLGVISNQCDADFGDARCKIVPVTVTGTVTAAASAMQMTLSYSGGPYADDYFNKGTVIGLTGVLAGTRAVPIEDWDDHGDGTATVTLFMPMVAVPAIGDTFTVRQGCFDPATGESKTRNACMHFSNMVNFRGEPDVPGSDQVLPPAIPGQGNG